MFKHLAKVCAMAVPVTLSMVVFAAGADAVVRAESGDAAPAVCIARMEVRHLTDYLW